MRLHGLSGRAKNLQRGQQKLALHTYVDFYISVDSNIVMNSAELRKFLAARGCTFETHKGGSGHLTVRRGDRKTQLPMHGRGKELGKGLVNKILKDLGLK